MKTTVKFIGFGITLYLFFLFTQLPVNKVYAVFEGTLNTQNPSIKLYGLSGTLWEGKAKRVSYGNSHFNQVAWDFHPLALLMGKLSATIRYKNPDGNASGIVSYGITGKITAENLRANIQASELIKMAKIPAVKLGGELKLNIPKLTASGKRIEYMNGRILWADAKSIFPQKLTLGDLVVDVLTTDDEVITAKLNDGGGALELKGNASVAPDGKYNFDGQFAAREGRQSVLGRALGFMARYNAQGKAVITKTGNISEFGFLLK